MSPVGKLTESQQLQVVEWIATFKSHKEIIQLIKERYGLLLDVSGISSYKCSKKWQPLIHRIRQEWAAGVAEIPIAHKRYRLNELLRMFEQCLSDKRLNLEQKRKEGMAILREARLEMDEAKTAFTNVFFTQIQNYTDEELTKRGRELVERIKHLGGLNATIRDGRQGVAQAGEILDSSGPAQNGGVESATSAESPAQSPDGLAGDSPGG